MSSRKPQKMRGPSRPVDPRRVPGSPAQKKRGPDTFGIALIALSTVFVLLVVFFVTSNSGQTNGTTTTTSSQPQQQVTPDATQQEVDFATKTAYVPRISAAEAINLYDAQNVKLFDVRTKDRFDIGHIKGAINLPNNEASKRMGEFPKSGNVVLYCQ